MRRAAARSRRYPYCYEQGIGGAVEDYEWDGLRVSGKVIDITQAQSSEEPMRNLYRRWAQFMEAESWDELATWRRRKGDGPLPPCEPGAADWSMRRPSGVPSARPAC